MSKLLRIFIVVSLLSFSFTFALSSATAAPGLTFSVNSTGDDTDVNPGDGVCEANIGIGDCTLRAAIEEANANGNTADTDVINFALTGPASYTVGGQNGYTITPATPLPTITSPLAFRGLTQSGSDCAFTTRKILVEINLANIGNITGPNFVAGTNDSVVEGLSIINGLNTGLQVDTSNNFELSCSNIGVRGDSTTGAGSRLNVDIFDSANINMHDTIVGGSTNSHGVISARNINATFDSNYIGTNLQSDNLGSLLDGLSHNDGNNLTLTNNVVGHNNNIGISVNNSDNVTLYGNYVGINKNLDTAIGNGGTGIEIRDGSDNFRVGSTAQPNYIFDNAKANPQYAGLSFFMNCDIGIVEGNFISGNANVEMTIFFNISHVRVVGNHIGPTANPSIPTSISTDNAIGIVVGGSSNNIIGGTNPSDANIIAGVSGAGIAKINIDFVGGPPPIPSLDNTFIGNSIYDVESVILSQYGGTVPFDMGLDHFSATDTDLDGLPNLFADLGPTTNDTSDADASTKAQTNFPILTSTIQTDNIFDVTYNLDAAGSPTNQYRVEFYASDIATSSGYGPGQTFIGYKDSAPGTGLTAQFALPSGMDIVGKTISVTATPIDATKTYGFGPTSEFGNQTVTVLGESATNTTPTTTTSTTQPGAAVAQGSTSANGTLSSTGTHTLGTQLSFVVLMLVCGLSLLVAARSRKSIKH